MTEGGRQRGGRWAWIPCFPARASPLHGGRAGPLPLAATPPRPIRWSFEGARPMSDTRTTSSAGTALPPPAAAAGTPPALGREQILRDYRLAVRSRQVSLLGRREVLTGKAKFGIFGDGKEIAQLAMAHFFRAGDFR